jgi:hypothetical protein
LAATPCVYSALGLVGYFSIPTAPTKPQETKDFLSAESAFAGSISN